MTERLYYRDSTLLNFDAVVTRVEEVDNRCHVYLDRSAFYPTSGGQSHDLGTINGHAVVDVVETTDGEVGHVMEKAVLTVGTMVKGIVDANRRLRNRQQHTAQHSISHLFVQECNAETVSVHLGDDYGAVELRVATLGNDVLPEIERLANALIAANHAVTILFVSAEDASRLPLRKQPTREGTLRVIRIGDLDWSACGGTHCNATAEVRIIKLIGAEKLRGHLLVKFLAGEQAIEDYLLRFEVTDKLAKAMTCHPADLTAKCELQIAENKELRKELTQLQKELLPHRAIALTEKATTIGTRQAVTEIVSGCDPSVLALMASLVAGKVQGVAMLMSGERIVIAASEDSGLTADQLVRGLCASTGLKGGGNARIAQFGGADPANFDQYRDTLFSLVRDA